MRKLFLVFFLFVVTMSSVADTLTIRSVFVEMPDSLIPYLSRNNRLDFIDFMDSKMKAEISNTLGGKSQMTVLTKDSLSLQLNETTKLDMFLLRTEQSIDSCHQVICLIWTVGHPSEYTETVVDYYSVNWRQLEKSPLLLSSDKKRIGILRKPSNILEYIKTVNKN